MNRPSWCHRGAAPGVVVATALVAFASVVGCQTKESLIVVAVSAEDNSYATGLRSLVVTCAGTRQVFELPSSISTTPVSVGLYVPSSTTGTQTVKAEAVGAACGDGYAGSATVDIAEAGATVDVQITMVDAMTCPNDGTGGTRGTGGTHGTGGTGGTGGSTGGTGGGTGAPDFSACTEIDHGSTGTCASCTLGGTTDVSVYGVAFSPNGTIVVTGGTDGRVKIWTNTNGTLTAQGTPLLGTGLGAVAFSPDGSSLAIGRIGGVDIVNVSSWTLARTLVTATGDEAYAVGFSPDGSTVFTTTAPSNGAGVTGTLYAHAVGNIQALTSVALTSPFGMAVASVNVSGGVPVAVTDGNGEASLFDWSATAKSFGTPLSLTVTSDGSTAEASAFSPQATVFAAGGDSGILSLWNYPTSSNAGPDGQISVTGQTLSSYIGAVAFSPIYGYVAVGGESFGSLTGYTLTDGSEVGVAYDTSYDVISVAYSPTSNVIVAGELDCGCVVVCPQ